MPVFRYSKGLRGASYRIILWILLCNIGVRAMPLRDDLYREATVAAHAGKYVQALQKIELLLQNDSTDVDALLLCGLVHRWNHKPDTAAIFFRKVLRQSPSYIDAWTGLIDALLDDNNLAAACSTVNLALDRNPGDTILTDRRKKMCDDMHARKTDIAPTRDSDTEFSMGGGCVLFGKEYHRDPWYTIEASADYSRYRWGLWGAVHAQQRSYGEAIFRAAELECTPYLHVSESMRVLFRLSLSPYSWFDSLYASHSVSAEINSGLPMAMEMDAALRVRWYGTFAAASYVAGLGIYHNALLFYARCYAARSDGTWYFSGAAHVRHFSPRGDRTYTAVTFSAGRSPFDAGAVIRNGYLTNVEMVVQKRFAAGSAIAWIPSLSLAGEQMVYETTDKVNGNTEKNSSDVRMRMAIALTALIIIPAIK